MKMKAAILRTNSAQRPFSVSKPLSIEEVELDPPKRGEVLIKVKAVGLCHSDLVAITGEREVARCEFHRVVAGAHHLLAFLLTTPAP